MTKEVKGYDPTLHMDITWHTHKCTVSLYTKYARCVPVCQRCVRVCANMHAHMLRKTTYKCDTIGKIYICEYESARVLI